MSQTDTAISKLQRAGKAELLAIWSKINGKPPPFRTSRELLASALAWQLQASKQGGLKPSVRRRLQAIAKADERKRLQTELDPSVRLRPGTILLRDWRGQRHAVTVLEEGFSYQGKSCQSLSHIARQITGTRWNGPAFFGLRKNDGTNRGGQ